MVSTNDNDELYHTPGYTFIKKNRKTGSNGGVAMYISDKINWKRRLDLVKDNIECMFVEIFPKNAKSFIIGCMYRPPVGSRYLSNDFNTIFNKMILMTYPLK